MLEEVAVLRRARKAEEAIRIAERAVHAAEDAFGAESEQTREAHNVLAELQRLRGYLARIEVLRDAAEYEEAASVARRVLAIQILQDGAGHPSTSECRRWLGEIDGEHNAQLAAWAPIERAITESLRARNFELAINAVVGLLKAQRSQLGNHHTAVADTLIRLGWLEEADGRAATAVPRFVEAIAIRGQVLGEQDWRVADARSSLATLRKCAQLSADQQRQLADFRVRASAVLDGSGAAVYQSRREQLERDLAMVHKYVGTDNRYYATAIVNVGIASFLSGDLVEAQRWLEQSVPLTESVYGPRHPESILARSHLGMACLDLADQQRAIELLQQTARLARDLFGEVSDSYVTEINRLARAWYTVRRYDLSLELMRQATDFCRETRGPDSAFYGQLLSELSHDYGAVADMDHERETALEALDVLKRTVDESNNHYLEALHHVALIEMKSRHYDESADRFRQLVDASRRVFGPGHRRYAVFLASAASFYQSRGEHTRAASMLKEAIQVLRRDIDGSFSAQSEQQQLLLTATFRGYLFGYLSSCAELGSEDADAYGAVLAWKGAVFRQQHLDAVINADRTSRELRTDLLRVASRLSACVYADTRSSNLIADLEALRVEKESIERKLAAHLQSLPAVRGLDSIATPDELASVLPPDAALIDFLRYNHFRSDAERAPQDPDFESRLLAFVVRRDHPVKMVPLGPLAAVDSAVENWKRQVARGGAALPAGAPADSRAESPGQSLYRLLWQPLETSLDEIRVVLTSPDGVTGEIPFGSLPHGATGHCLLEDYAFAVVPFAQQLPRMLSEPTTRKNKASLLLVGDVDYGPAAAKSEALAAARHWSATFTSLPGTAVEATTIRALFQAVSASNSVTLVSGGAATETEFRNAAGQYRYLHLATHGFYAAQHPQTMDSGNDSSQDCIEYLTERVPGLLCGIVMAGANDRAAHPDSTASDAMPDDGILTALEVSALELRNVELATLSACETTLGQSPEGEGMLGLQRAFQVAGARSTVTSLWTVDDAATQALMTEFYRNLWDRKLGKLEALRQAQLALLERYDPQARQLRPRGLTLAAPQGTPETLRLSPYYWAPFVLSGDWR